MNYPLELKNGEVLLSPGKKRPKQQAAKALDFPKKANAYADNKISLWNLNPKTSSIFFKKTLNKIRVKLVRIRKQAGTGSSKHISDFQRKLVGDKSDFFISRRPFLKKETLQFSDYNRLLRSVFNLSKIFANLLRLVLKSTSRCLTMVPVMNPNSRIYMLFEILSALLIAFILFITSISVCFKVSPIDVLPLETWENNRLMYQLLISVSCFVFSADIFCSFYTSYYEHGQLIKKRSRIVENYLRTNFIWDLISCIPVYINATSMLSTENESHQYKSHFFVDFLFFFKFKDLVGTFEKVNELISIRENLEIIFSLVKLSLQILLISHTAACLWYFMSSGENGTWIAAKQVENESLQSKYIYSLYWALTTLATVGYGDITPQNPREMIFALGVMLIGSFLFGYSLNKIGNLVDSVNKKSNELKKTLKVINWYMNEKNIDMDLQKRVRKYMEFKIINENSYFFLAEEILQKNLSGQLKEEFLQESYHKFWNAFPVIIGNFSPSTMKKLTTIVKTINCRPDEIIEQRGEKKDPAIYFIYKGEVGMKVEMNNDNKRNNLILLKQGDTFGEFEFFTDKTPFVSLKSVNYTTILSIDRNDFLSIVKESRADYEKLCEIRDALLMKNDCSILKKKCLTCSSFDHTLRECSMLFLKPINLIEKLIYSPIQERRKYARGRLSGKTKNKNKIKNKKSANLLTRTAKSSSALKSFKKNQSAAIQFVNETNIFASGENRLSLQNERQDLDADEPISFQRDSINDNQAENLEVSESESFEFNPPPENSVKFLESQRKASSVHPEIILNLFQKPQKPQNSENNPIQNNLKTVKNENQERRSFKESQNERGVNQQDDEPNTKQSFFFANFDANHNFSNYFPHNNPRVVLGVMSSKSSKKLK